ncbi:hypothetical protein AAMO2058_000059700 [Amorphochlora amoebiformis]
MPGTCGKTKTTSDIGWTNMAGIRVLVAFVVLALVSPASSLSRFGGISRCQSSFPAVSPRGLLGTNGALRTMFPRKPSKRGLKLRKSSGSFWNKNRPSLPVFVSMESHKHSMNSSDGLDGLDEHRRRREREKREESFRLLPIFPLHDEVVFPDGRISLRLYEERYLKLFSTILYGEEEIDTTLVDEESPYLSTARFGIVWRTPSSVPGVPGNLARTGVVMEIESHEWLGMDGSKSGQLIVNAKGYKRFKVQQVIRQDPVLEALIDPVYESVLPLDRKLAEKELCRKLISLCDSVRKLSAEKAMRRAYFSMEDRMRVLTKLAINETAMLQLSGEELSYWVAEHMFESLVEQQEMLQLPTPRRLRYQVNLLSESKGNLVQEAYEELNGTRGG